MDIKSGIDLLRRYQEGTCSPDEKKLVEEWYDQLKKTGEWHWEEGEKDTMQKAMEARLLERISESGYEKPVPARRLYTIALRKWTSVAAVITVCIAGYYLFRPAASSKNAQAKVTSDQKVEAPGISKAVLTLSNGEKIYLDSAQKGQLAVQGSTKLVKMAKGEIAYEEAGKGVAPVLSYNTLFNPRGSRVITITLSDGSKVWLNNGSSITYPVVFAGNERKVSIIGEAYFEVYHDAAKPFIVAKNDMEIRVLGTHFNVNAFEDEKDAKITLLEGAVKVSRAGKSSAIKPGQQAVLSTVGTGPIELKNQVDLEAVMAWKDGYFRFENESLQGVLRQLSRWYDVDVVMVDEQHLAPVRFEGEMERGLDLDQVLKILEKNGVHFNIRDRKIVVMP
jgi:ferric-dicitrate binding protein FerR (iron transport regulator)